MRKKNQINQTDLEDIKRQNSHLEAQIRALERAKTTGNFQSAADILSDQGLLADGETLASVTADLHAGSSSGASARTAASGIAVAPGQSLLLSNGGATPDPPKKKMKHWFNDYKIEDSLLRFKIYNELIMTTDEFRVK